MADIVNLRRLRKQRVRADDEKTAAANRVAFGTPKATRDLTKAQRTLDARKLDAHRREDDAGS